MRIATYITFALPALAFAQEQIPLLDRLRGYVDQAQDLAASAVNQFASFTPDAGASKVAAKNVTPLTFANWKDVLQHSGSATSGGAEPWMVYITGGNRTCHGRCAQADRAWNESVALLSRDASAPRLASVDCESSEILCGAWACQTPAVWFFLVPKPGPDQSQPPTLITEHPLNATSVTNDDIVSIHSRQTYLSRPPVQGMLHPFDGWVAKAGLTVPMAYTLYALGKIPSWAMMLGISLFSRNFMARRMPQAGQPQRRA